MTEEEPQINDWVDILILPNQIMYLDSKTLINLRSISKIFHQKEYQSLWWTALSNSVAKERGLYFPLNMIAHDPKQFFFEEIWPARNKFLSLSENDEEKVNNFNIKVSARFRPGIKENDNLSLPLHQFLKIQRKKMKALKDKQNNEENPNSDKAFVGEDDPEEFCCPLLGTLLKDPVLLKTSNKIISRSVAIQCILRQGRDPFNNMKLSMNHLEEQVELAKKIDEWRRKKAEVDVSLKREDVLNYYISDNNIDPEILATLVEAERLQHASNRAILYAKDDEFSTINNTNNNGNNNGNNDGDNNPGNNPETNENNDNINQNGNNNSNNLNDSNKNDENDVRNKENDSNNNNFNDDNISTSRWRKGPKETAKVVDINSINRSISMAVPGAGIRPFHFSNVYSGNAKQAECYSTSVHDLVTGMLNGQNTAFICYGQTGSGKTHTMFGPDSSIEQNEVNDDTGVVIRTIEELMQATEIMSKNNINIQLSCSFVEIYNEDVTCLLSGDKVQIRRGNGQLVGASEKEVTSMDEALNMIRIGQARKTFAATAMNERSSRSHTAIIFYCKQVKDGKYISTSLTLVDLAGSERVKKSKVTGGRMQEAIGINSSLLILGKVINSLVESKRHVPFYECKLTTLLKNAFTNSLTSVMINCRHSFGDETLSSLRFGERCAQVSNNLLVAATDATSALETLDDSIKRIQTQLDTMKEKNLTEMNAFKKVSESLNVLLHKRQYLVKAAANNSNTDNNQNDNINSSMNMPENKTITAE